MTRMECPLGNIDDRAYKLIATMREYGFKGMKIPNPHPGCFSSWTANYANVYDLFYDTDELELSDAVSEYFDYDRLETDFINMIRDLFTFPGEETIIVEGHDPLGGNWIVINYSEAARELEVYRIVDGKTIKS